MIQGNDLGARSYLDALNNYEASATQEAIAPPPAAKYQSGIGQYAPHDLDYDAWPEPAAVRAAVMLRWHYSRWPF